MATIEVKVPDIGDFSEVAVIEVLVKAGDTIKVEQSLVTVESDKASMEIPSSHAGVVKELKIQLGDKVSEGSVVLLLETADAAAGAEPSPANAEAPVAGSEVVPGASEASAAARAADTAGAGQQAAASAPLGSVEVLVPDIGDFKDVERGQRGHSLAHAHAGPHGVARHVENVVDDRLLVLAGGEGLSGHGYTRSAAGSATACKL